MILRKKIEINNLKKKIYEINVIINENFANEAVIDGQRRYSRTITLKQFNPITMNWVLKLYSQNLSISRISEITSFSRKAIKMNLEKSKMIDISYVKNGIHLKKPIMFLKETTTYSIKKWVQNWLSNSSKKSLTWTRNSEKKYKHFIYWFKNFKNPLGIKLSVDLLLYYWHKEKTKNNLNDSQTPAKSTIYYWIEHCKYGFNKQMFIKLSKGLYYKNKSKPMQRIYDDNSKSILDFEKDMKSKSLDNAYEIDLVKGSKNDEFSILTCINKRTRKLYSKIVKPNSIDVKNKLESIIKENNLKIDQLIIDNGSENVLLHKIKNIKQIYRCRPYCSSDKGQIENIHRLLRYWIKKGKSIDKISQEILNNIVEKINNYPRRVYESGKLMSANEFQKQT